jgi:hypothetical protein
MADELRQRQPRERDHVYLRFIRAQPCCICGDNTAVEAAHLRVGSINDDKRETGGGERPSDKWALPLCGKHHREQHSMNEMLFWTRYGIDPFALAMHYHVKSRSDDPLVQALKIEHGDKP